MQTISSYRAHRREHNRGCRAPRRRPASARDSRTCKYATGRGTDSPRFGADSSMSPVGWARSTDRTRWVVDSPATRESAPTEPRGSRVKYYLTISRRRPTMGARSVKGGAGCPRAGVRAFRSIVQGTRLRLLGEWSRGAVRQDRGDHREDGRGCQGDCREDDACTREKSHLVAPFHPGIAARGSLSIVEVIRGKGKY